MANRNISGGEEILFDYGERRPEVIQQDQWLEPESNPKRSSRRAAGKCLTFLIDDDICFLLNSALIIFTSSSRFMHFIET